MHLRNEQFPVDVVKEYTHDIFGWCETNGIDSFDATLDSLKERWDSLEKAAFSDRKSCKPQFHEWFLKWKGGDFRHGTLRGCRFGVTAKAFLYQ